MRPAALSRVDDGLGLIEAVRGMPQKDKAQDGHKVFIGRETRIGAEVIGDLPKVSFEFRNAG
jgi:hypothetical protein